MNNINITGNIKFIVVINIQLGNIIFSKIVLEKKHKIIKAIDVKRKVLTKIFAIIILFVSLKQINKLTIVNYLNFIKK